MESNVNNAEHKRILTQCIETNGVRHQIVKAIEELSELSVELAKVSNYTSMLLIETNQDRVCDEIADVKVMIAQLEMIFPSEHINERYEFKLNRLNNRLNPFITIERNQDEPNAL